MAVPVVVALAAAEEAAGEIAVVVHVPDSAE